MRGDTYVRELKADGRAVLRLFCFPYAGVGPSVYREWAGPIAPGTDVLGVEYPGRESLSRSPPVSDIHALVDRIVPGLLPHLDKPFVLFGHSMGSLVAYEVTRALRSRHALRPELLIVSGAAAPHCPEERPLYALPTKDFVRGLLRLNGMPPEVLADPEVLLQALPILRADFTLCETYRYVAGPPVTCPILALGGQSDPRVNQRGLEAWRDHAGVAFTRCMVPGDHFFIRSNRRRAIGVINRELIALIDALSSERGAETVAAYAGAE